MYVDECLYFTVRGKRPGPVHDVNLSEAANKPHWGQKKTGPEKSVIDLS